MRYQLNNKQGYVLFIIYACILTPGVPILSKTLALNDIKSSIMAFAMIGYSGAAFIVVGELIRLFYYDRTPPVYTRYLAMPGFYAMTILMAFTLFCFFQALQHLPAAVLSCGITITPLLLYNLRLFYRPRSINTSVVGLTILGFVSVYIVLFGFSLPNFKNNQGLMWGTIWLLGNLFFRCFYQIEREVIAKKTTSWLESVRFAGLHRVASAACFLPFLTRPSTRKAITFDTTALALVVLAVIGGLSWLVGFHVLRALGSYWTAYRHVLKLSVVAIGEVALLGVWLDYDQYIGLVGIAILSTVLYSEIKKDSN